jgi:hypothetical protein
MAAQIAFRDATWRGCSILRTSFRDFLDSWGSIMLTLQKDLVSYVMTFIDPQVAASYAGPDRVGNGEFDE